MKTAILTACLVSMVALPMPALAQQRVETMTYQGRLTENGQPANGVFDLQFTFWDSPVGGLLVGSDIVLGVEVTDGLLTAQYSMTTPPAIKDTYLEIVVKQQGGSPFTLSPRQLITPAPLAATASGAEKLADGDVVFLRGNDGLAANAGPSNADAAATTVTQTFTPSVSGRPLSTFIGRLPLVAGTCELREGADAGGRLIATGAVGAGDEFGQTSFDATEKLLVGQVYTLVWTFPGGADIFYSSIDVYGGGESSFGPKTDIGFSLFVENPGDPAAFVESTGRAEFNGLRIDGFSGDGSVALPDNAINADETAEEAGVAGEFGYFGVLPEPLTVITSRSISVPGPGYVLANFSGEFLIFHTNGSSSSVIYGVSSSSTSISPTNNDMQIALPTGAATGTYEMSGSAVGLFPVTGPGTRTFYVLADRVGSNDMTLEDYGFTLLYVPTAYGATD